MLSQLVNWAWSRVQRGAQVKSPLARAGEQNTAKVKSANAHAKRRDIAFPPMQAWAV
jgi:hypothetical protein